MLVAEIMEAVIVIAALVVVGVLVKLLARTSFWWAPGGAAVAGAFALLAGTGSSSSSRCTGSPVCGLDGLARLGEVIAGLGLLTVGLLVIAIAAGMHRHARRRGEPVLPRAIAR
jgi:hypothetical protein